jgi:hypothetical protein
MLSLFSCGSGVRVDPLYCSLKEAYCNSSWWQIHTGHQWKNNGQGVCECKAKASHSHKMWTMVSSSVPHFLQMGLLLSPLIYRCILKVLRPVSRPITTLDCVLLKDNNWALVARSRPEINSRACLCVLQGLQHNIICLFSIQRFIFLLIFCLKNPKKGLGPTNRWTELSLVSLLVISFPRTPACSGTQHSPTACRVEISFNAFWHSRTKGDLVLAAWSAFRAVTSVPC